MSLKKYLFAFTLITLLYGVTAEENSRYRIENVRYLVTGTSRPYALGIAVKIDRTRIFDSENDLSAYIADIELQLENQRVLESVEIETSYGDIGDGVIPVFLDIKTVDTWNIIVVPYPKYNSNTGFQFKLKLKDFNAFGSLQPLTVDLIYQNDEEGQTHLGGAFDMEIPFTAFEHEVVWNINAVLDVPLPEPPDFAVSSGIDIRFPISDIFDLHTGIVQGFNLNDRNDDGILYAQDNHYFTEKVYANVPVLLGTLGHLGQIHWTPSVTAIARLDGDGLQNSDLIGPELSIAHSVSVGRTDRTHNFRDGLVISASNSWTYNLHFNRTVPVIEMNVQGYRSFFDMFGVTARVDGYVRFDGSVKTTFGEKLRGIRDNRISSDTAFVLNVDLPVRIFRIDFSSFERFRKLDIFSCEVQLSPFMDIALTHDEKSGRYFDPSEGWYAGGMEMLVYPKKMRSIYGRASFGVDVPEFINSGFNLDSRAKRDNAEIFDFSVGIGLHY
jgi:hypothetical protein